MCFLFFFSEKFTESQIVANAFVLFAAGFETTSSSISFCLYELALKKQIQDKVRAEIKMKRVKYNGETNNDYLAELDYLEMVIAGNVLLTQKLTTDKEYIGKTSFC